MSNQLSDREIFLEGMFTLQEHSKGMLLLGGELAKLMHAVPARMSLDTLTAAEPTRTLAELGNARSVGIFNWSSVEVQIGYAGRSATAGNGIPVPPRSWLVLPLEVNQLDVGADQTDLRVVGEARVAAVRFTHALPLMAGSLGGPLLPLSDTVGAAGEVVGAASGVTVVTLAVPAGVYDVEVNSSTSAGTANDFSLALVHGATTVTPVASVPVAMTTRARRVTIAAGETLRVVTTANLTAGVICSVTIAATRIG